MAPNDLLALRAFLNQPDTLLFVGSGLSLWSGIPGWRTIIERLVAAAEEKGARTGIATQALASGNLLEAADALQLTASEIAHEMRTRLGFSTATPHEIHALLTRLGPQRFVTTNYDTLIEQQL